MTASLYEMTGLLRGFHGVHVRIGAISGVLLYVASC